MNTFALGRLVIFAILVPLAIVLGYLVSNPFSTTSVALVGSVMMVLVLPVVLRWHHVLLILSWNAFVNVFFLPGQPQLWFFMAVVSLGASLVRRAMVANARFVSVPAVTWSLILILAVVVGTAMARGGIGVRALGGNSYGGRGYVYVLGAIIGYFALSAQRIPVKHANLLVSGYWLSGITAVVSNLAYFAGPKFYFLYLLFPADIALNQAMADFSGQELIRRITGFAMAASAVACFLFARYGIKGTFNLRHPWRAGLLVVALGAGMFSGFRSTLVIVGFLGVILFFLEGLHKTRAVAWVIVASLALFCFLVPFASKLPLSVQRSLSVLPLPLDQMARQDALHSSDWRLQMWQVMVAQVPDYLWLGKGYTLDPTALYLAEQGMRRGYLQQYEVALVAGDYHNGPLSVIIPFGVWGVAAFGLFLSVGLWVLYRNYRYGDRALERINTFFFAFFIMRSVFFIFLFGAFNSELFLFTGVLGLSVAINGGVAAKRQVSRGDDGAAIRERQLAPIQA